MKVAGLIVDLDASNNTLQKRIRSAQVSQYNYILVVGEDEREKESVNVRTRDGIVHGTKKVVDFMQELVHLNNEHFVYTPKVITS